MTTGNMFSVEGKTVFICGASSEIGRSFSLKFATLGSNVVLGTRNGSNMKDIEDKILSMKTEAGIKPGKTTVLELDVSGSLDEVDAAVGKAWEAFGGIDVLITNAGAAEASPENFFATSEDDWDKVLRVNVRGTGLVTQAMASRMTTGKTKGSIINMASCFGTEPGVVPGIGIYSASKAAIVQLTKVLAFELGSHNIRVNCIAPGIFQSGVSEETWEKVKDNSKMVPMRRWGEAEDLTALAVLLASNASEYITGTCLLVDGRLTLGMTPLVT